MHASTSEVDHTVSTACVGRRPNAPASKRGPGRYHLPDDGGHSISVTLPSSPWSRSHQSSTHCCTFANRTACGTGGGPPRSSAGIFG